MRDETRKTLGVIGGLGPQATAWYMELIVRMTEAGCDQEHIDMIVYNCPRIPDRTEYILGRSDRSPLPEMTRIGGRLAEDGADIIAIPCMTAHYFYDELSRALHVPIIHAIRETGSELLKNGVRRAGLMATDGTVLSGIFQRQFAGMGLEAIVPDERHQGYVMDIIYKNVKAGLPADMDRFREAADHLRQQGAEALVLGCTELSLVKRDCDAGAGLLDTLEVLARESVLRCGGSIKGEYASLIS